MRIVIDSNRIIAALLKASTTRDILFAENLEFITPEHTLGEIRKYQAELCGKAKINKEEFELLFGMIFERIRIIPQQEYQGMLDHCRREIKDPDDAPYLAVYRSTHADGIWSHDSDLVNMIGVKVYTNIDLLRLSE